MFLSFIIRAVMLLALIYTWYFLLACLKKQSRKVIFKQNEFIYTRVIIHF